jgi:hypothetical protein
MRGSSPTQSVPPQGLIHPPAGRDVLAGILPGHAGHEDHLRLGGLGPGGGSGARQVPVNPGAIPDVSAAAPAPAAPPATAREVLDVPSYPEEGVQRHIEYLLTPRSRPGQRDVRGGTGLWRPGHLATCRSGFWPACPHPMADQVRCCRERETFSKDKATACRAVIETAMKLTSLESLLLVLIDYAAGVAHLNVRDARIRQLA